MRVQGLIIACALGVAPPAWAQGPGAGARSDGWQVQVGGGGLVTPDFRGSTDYRVRALPYVSVKFGDAVEASVQEGVSFALVDRNGFSAGPLARFRFGQEEDDNRALVGLGEVDPSLEAGGFLGYRRGPFSLRLTAGQDVIGGHGGGVTELGAALTAPIARTAAGPVLASAGPKMTFVTSKVNRAYFGVDGSQAAASGLPVFRPSGGLQAAGLNMMLIAPIAPKLSVVGFVGFERLLGDAAESPRVQQRGSRDQASGGIFITYRLF